MIIVPKYGILYYKILYPIERSNHMAEEVNITTLEKQEKELAAEINKAREEGKSEAWIRQNLDI